VGNDPSVAYLFDGTIDEVRITKGVARYASDAGYTVSTEPFPRGAETAPSEGHRGIYHGSQRVASRYHGSTPLARVYHGSTLVFDKTAGSGDTTGPYIFGNTNPTVATNLGTNTIYLLRILPDRDCTLVSIGALPSQTKTVHRRGIIYADNGGTPRGGALLAQTAEATTTTQDVASILNLTTPLDVASGVPLWIGLHIEPNALGSFYLEDNTTGPHGFALYDSYTDGSPDPFPADGGGNSSNFGFWVTTS